MLTTAKMYNYIELYDGALFEIKKLDKQSKELLIKLWDLIKTIKPIGENTNRRSFYFFTPKGSYEEYRELYDKDFDSDLFENDEEKLKKLYSYEEDSWFKLMFLYHRYKEEEEPFLGLLINDFYLLSINDANEKNIEIDASEFINELIDITKDVINQLKENTYNDNIKKSLPYNMKYGKISRKDYCKVFPYEKEKYRITKKNKELILNEYNFTKVPKTAREFYEACKVCYNSVKLNEVKTFFKDDIEEKIKYRGNTPKELYYTYADGRDDGLNQVPLDDEVEFNKWLNHEDPYNDCWGGHPFEIIYSFTSEHSIHLYLHDNKLILTCGSYPSNIKALKMYIGLIKKQYNVEFTNLSEMLDILNKEDYIGIIPTYTFSKSDLMEDDKKVYECINLEKDDYDKLKDYIIWDDIPNVELLE